MGSVCGVLFEPCPIQTYRVLAEKPAMVTPLFFRRLSAWFAPLACALLTGCASQTQIHAPEAEPAANYRMLTLPIVALGDTQEHVATGFPMHDNDSAVDAYVEVAQRPPEQALFGRRMMDWALHDLEPGEPFLHLGDVLDLSCRIEAQRMKKVFQSTDNPGALLPGNHDGLFFGVFAVDLLDLAHQEDARKWNRACRRGAGRLDTEHKSEREAFTKRDFIAYYLQLLRERRALTGTGAEGAGDGKRVSWRNPDPKQFLSGVEAVLTDGQLFANSFIAQRLRLPAAPGAARGVIVIGLDTNQAGQLVGIWDTIMRRSPGSLGHLHPDQLAAVRPWVDEASAAGDIVVFAGHHDWNSLSLTSREFLRLLMQSLPHPLVYLSAHTHRGFWSEHRATGQRPILELNVSSLSDWPLAYRRISFGHDPVANRILVKADLLPKGATQHESDADLLAAWLQKTCAQSGIPLERLMAQDRAEVMQQRDMRGSLIEWLVESASSFCEACGDLLYEHSQNYLNQMLAMLKEASADLGEDARKLHEARLPEWCKGRDFVDCANALLAERADGHTAIVDRFGRTAELVGILNDNLDQLNSRPARSYMTCRAVLAAKMDFDLTPDDKNAQRGEANRKAAQFFRVEASIGMQ